MSMEAHKELVAVFLHALVHDDSQAMRPLVHDDVIWWVPSSASRRFGLDRPF
jgi:ketosteroid isomerase-like protein